MTPGNDRRPGAVVLMDPEQFDSVWGPGEVTRLVELVNIVTPPARTLPAERNGQFANVEVVITGWGARPLDRGILDALPKLAIVLHAAGSVRSLATAEFWDSQIPVVSAVDENTRPTAEFAAAEIVYGLKKGWQSAAHVRRTRDWHSPLLAVPGLTGSVVGLVSLGRVGRYVAERLAAIGTLRVLGYDPHLAPAEADALGIELVSLSALFAAADVISVHTPWLPETTGLITGELLRSMKPGATLINTARGAIIDQDALIQVLIDRPDVFAALDVTHPEPPDPDSPLYDLPNVTLTPHIAGSTGDERRALARSVLTQLERFLTGHPIHTVSHEDLRSRLPTRRTAPVEPLPAH